MLWLVAYLVVGLFWFWVDFILHLTFDADEFNRDLRENPATTMASLIILMPPTVLLWPWSMVEELRLYWPQLWSLLRRETS